jgi:WD40 repeat protein
MWELKTGKCLHTMKGHADEVVSVSLSPDNRCAVSGSRDNTLRMWELKFGNSHQAEPMISLPKGYEQRRKEEDTLNEAISEAEELFKRGDHKKSYKILHKAWKGIHFSHKNEINRLYSGLMKKGRIRDFAFSFQKKILKAYTSKINSISLTPDGRFAITGSDDNTLKVWELETGLCLHTMEGHADEVFSVSLTPDGLYAVSASRDKTLRMWELETGRCLRTMEGHTELVNSVSIAPDGRYAVSGSKDRTLRMWKLSNGHCVRTIYGGTNKIKQSAVSLALTPDGRYAFSGSGVGHSPSKDRILQVWDLEAGKRMKTIAGINHISITPDGRYGVGGSMSTLGKWNFGTGKCVYIMEGHTDIVSSVSITANGRYAVSGSADHTLRLWDLDTGKCINTMKGHITSSIASVALTQDSRYAVSGYSDGNIQIWELIWDLEFPDPSDWDEGVRPYLENFLTLKKGKWTDEDFQELITDLAEKRGYGWVRPEGIRKELERMTREYRN